MKALIKVVLSLWIVFHLFHILILPNGSSYLGRSWGQFLLFYGNSAGLNSTWNFFSPDPAHTMYLKFRIHFPEKEGLAVRDNIEGTLPPEKEHIVIDSSRRRLLYAMRFLLLDQNRMNTLLGPWLCRQYPGADVISISHILHPIPSLEAARAAMIASPQTSVSSLTEEIQSPSFEMNCLQAQDEVSL